MATIPDDDGEVPNSLINILGEVVRFLAVAVLVWLTVTMHTHKLEDFLVVQLLWGLIFGVALGFITRRKFPNRVTLLLILMCYIAAVAAALALNDHSEYLLPYRWFQLFIAFALTVIYLIRTFTRYVLGYW